jgi:hypothetical protein
MGFANFVTAAVESDDPKIKGSCMVILHEDDPAVRPRATTLARPSALLDERPDPLTRCQPWIIGGYAVRTASLSPTSATAMAPSRLPPHRAGISDAFGCCCRPEPVIRYQRIATRRAAIAGNAAL